MGTLCCMYDSKYDHGNDITNYSHIVLLPYFHPIISVGNSSFDTHKYLIAFHVKTTVDKTVYLVHTSVKLIVIWWCQYVVTDLGQHCLRKWCQAINWTSSELLLIVPLEAMQLWLKFKQFHWRKYIWKVVCKMVAILFSLCIFKTRCLMEWHCVPSVHQYTFFTIFANSVCDRWCGKIKSDIFGSIVSKQSISCDIQLLPWLGMF